RPLRRFDDLGHGESLARAGDSEEHLADVAILRNALDQFPDRRRLIAGRLIFGHDLEALSAFRLLRPRGLVRNERRARFRFRQRCPDLNRHRGLYGQWRWWEQPTNDSTLRRTASASADGRSGLLLLPHTTGGFTWDVASFCSPASLRSQPATKALKLTSRMPASGRSPRRSAMPRLAACLSSRAGGNLRSPYWTFKCPECPRKWRIGSSRRWQPSTNAIPRRPACLRPMRRNRARIFSRARARIADMTISR